MSENDEKMSWTSWKPAHAGARSRVPEAVVVRALLRIGQHLVRLGRRLEALLGLLVARIAVGVQLHRELAIGALELAGIGVSADAKYFVIIPSLGHC